MIKQQVEDICHHLSPLLKNILKTKIINTEVPYYTYGEALLFWFADWIARIKLIRDDQVRLLIETFTPTIKEFGEKLFAAYPDGKITSIQAIQQLPICKIGFLDRKIACIDGNDQFLDLENGETFLAVERMPLETLAYNLTVLFVRYINQLNRLNRKEH